MLKCCFELEKGIYPEILHVGFYHKEYHVIMYINALNTLRILFILLHI